MIIIHIGIQINIDIKDKSVELVEIADYPFIRARIRDAISRGEDIDIYIKNPICNDWFWDLDNHPIVSFKNEDPRERLKKKLGLQTLPQDLDANPSLIEQLGLLELPTPETKVIDVWNWIIGDILGSPWQIANPSFNHLADLVIWYLNIDYDKLQLLEEKIKECINNWVLHATGLLKSAYQIFFMNPTKSSVFLGAWKNLAPYYHDSLMQWLTEENFYNPDLEWVADKLESLPMPAGIISNLSLKTEAYWNGILTNNNKRIDEILSAMSGRLLGELRALLNNEKLRLTTGDLESIRIKFINIKDTSQLIEEYNKDLPPDLPRYPILKWNVSEWKAWALNEYIPYKKWLIDHQKRDENINKLSIEYEEWLYTHYPKFTRSFNHLIYGISKYIEKLLNEGNTIVWLLLDNLPIFWQKILSIDLVEKNFIPADMQENPIYFFSMIPSETSISRLSSLLGQLPKQIEDKAFEDYFIELWKSRGAKRVTISYSIEELAKNCKNQADIHLLIYTKLDSLAHRPDHEIDDRESEVEFMLKNLTDKVYEICHELSELNMIKLIVSTDHGSTKIVKEARNVPVPSSATSDEIFEQHRRFIKVSSLEALDEHDWFKLNADRYGLNTNYAVVKGDKYIGSRPTGYTHGGLTPEETLIALSFWELGKLPQELKLTVSHVSAPIIRGRPQQISVKIRNPFSYRIDNVSITIPDSGFYLHVKEITAITEVEIGPTEIQLPARKPVSGGISEVDTLVTYDIAGVTKHEVNKMHIHVRELYKTGLDDFANMFE